jgi:hypothetical protein
VTQKTPPKEGPPEGTRKALVRVMAFLIQDFWGNSKGEFGKRSGKKIHIPHPAMNHGLAADLPKFNDGDFFCCVLYRLS